MELFLLLKSHWQGLTPELSRTAARNGGVVHVTHAAEPRSGLGLNELLGRCANVSNGPLIDRMPLLSKCSMQRLPKEAKDQAAAIWCCVLPFAGERGSGLNETEPPNLVLVIRSPGAEAAADMSVCNA